jgi:hypothetical protein
MINAVNAVIILEIVDAVLLNAKNAVWHVVKVQVIVFFFFSYVVDYVAELRSTGTVVMNVINAVLSAVENRVKIFLFFHWY